MPVSLEKVRYGGWPNCYRLSNGLVELIATSDVGPRLIRFGFVGGPNEFVEFPDMLGQTGGDVFRLYGGHRFWQAPEDPARTYVPDNAPVAVEELADGLRLRPPVERAAEVQKEIVVRLGPGENQARVTHCLRNVGLETIELAPWALSAMAPGGTAVVPLPPRGTHPQAPLPASRLVLWPYTDLSDPRWTWGRRHVLLRQDAGASAPTPQKLGASVPDGWVAYARGGHLFVKTFSPAPDAAYPDLGCSVELFADGHMLELETLGPLACLAPGASVEHVEDWRLWDGVPVPRTDGDVEAHVRPLAAAG